MEMKRLIPTIMPACCLVLLFSACSEKSSYTQLIPGDASSVVAVNLQSLTEKQAFLPELPLTNPYRRLSHRVRTTP